MYARSRYARELASRAQTVEAKVQLDMAQRSLKQSLKPSETLRSWEERKLNGEIYRALVLNCEQMKDIAQMKTYLNDWVSEHPDDQWAKRQRDRLYTKFRIAE